MALLNTSEFAPQLMMELCLVTSERWEQHEEGSGCVHQSEIKEGDDDICIHCTTEKMWEEEERSDGRISPGDANV